MAGLQQRLPPLLAGLAGRSAGGLAGGELLSWAQPASSLLSARCFQTAADPGSAGRLQAAARSTIPLRTGRPRLVVLGTGWGGARLVRDIDPKVGGGRGEAGCSVLVFCLCV